MTDTMTDTLFTVDEAGTFHVADPWTSKAAARTIGVKLGTSRFLALHELVHLGDVGATGYELAGYIGTYAHTATTRAAELVEAGYARRTDSKRATDTGTPAVVFEVTTAGAVKYADIIAGNPDRFDVVIAEHRAARRGRPLGRPAVEGRGRASRHGFTTARDRVLEVLADDMATGHTDYELGVILGILRTAAGTARRQLTEAGYVSAGLGLETRDTDGKHAALVHRITEAGHEHLVELARVASRAE